MPLSGDRINGMAFTLRYALLGVALLGTVGAEPFTPKHEAGRCAIRGNCGKQSLFGGELPCVDNGLAEEPEEGVREQLVELCGPKWSSGLVCCKKEQVGHTILPLPEALRPVLTLSQTGENPQG
jgi:Niemann-Pick C1 protein